MVGDRAIGNAALPPSSSGAWAAMLRWLIRSLPRSSGMSRFRDLRCVFFNRSDIT